MGYFLNKITCQVFEILGDNTTREVWFEVKKLIFKVAGFYREKFKFDIILQVFSLTS